MRLPARETFDRDLRVTKHRLWVYRFFEDTCDIHEKREVKLESVVYATGIHKANAYRAMRWLIDHGYVIEHSANESKQYTLAYSVRKELRVA